MQTKMDEEQEGEEEEISKEAPTKTGSNLKRNHQNKDKKANSSKKAHAIHHFTENTPVGTTYTQALKQLLVKGKINLPEIKAEIEAFRRGNGTYLFSYKELMPKTKGKHAYPTPGVVPSTLHQKEKILIKGHVITIEEDNLCVTITNKGLVLEVEYNRNDEELYNFETMAFLEKDKAPLDFDPGSNLNMNDILKRGDNSPFYGFPEPRYIKEKGILVSKLEVFNDCQRLEKEVLTTIRGDPSTQDWVNLAESNTFRILFKQSYRKKEDPVTISPLVMSNSGFKPTNSIIKANTEGHK
ncbi:hypothetical protein Cgig2_032931 [Carnegiea gigantea]|uniref:Uncharacterized protein n=1 Tax=Carnegiea gigantea TaxID=171969 RepID=A0A9Q1GN44_9CARY|nr:hypothetical protein Cgig2_032931 [Carnegiea gigantea]